MIKFLKQLLVFIGCVFSLEARVGHKAEAADFNRVFPFSLKQNLAYKDYVFQEEGIFTAEECDKIIAISRSFPPEKASIEGVAPDGKLALVRKSRISWIGWTPETDWIFRRLQEWAVKINDHHYRFDLSGIFDKLQFTEYEAPDSHYTWHEDLDKNSPSTRKLSIVTQLSDPNDYEGGELQFFLSSEITIPRKKGATTFFPPYLQHRVKPITKGKRYSLVVWVNGPPFR